MPTALHEISTQHFFYEGYLHEFHKIFGSETRNRQIGAVIKNTGNGPRECTTDQITQCK